ncbi:hypothetical protein DPMN_050702 [Dreissena polymorpha]|uniref:SET domain-containing protein n=1 Tax=Dreissena polymorpha TaxID=45954 RepID=A0A9D4CGM1_DREPO|nr:hypothetical protein DPMN_050702 [Dreissena polymorpha]
MKNGEPRQTNYMFFFRVPSGRKWCIDGAMFCGCHPLYEFLATPRWCINHSRKDFNLKPYVYTLDDKPVVLLKAVFDIKEKEELLFDYGVRKGEDGEPIEWLNW